MTTTDPTSLHQQAQAAEAAAGELRTQAAAAERAAHAQRQARRTEQYQGFLDTYSDALNAKLVASAQRKLMATDFMVALVELMEAKIWRGRARQLADEAVYDGGATPRQPLPVKHTVPIVADLHDETARIVAALAADTAYANVEARLQVVHDEAQAAYNSVLGREPTHYKISAVNRPGEDFSELVGGEPVFFTDGVAYVNAQDPRLPYFRRTPAGYDVVGVFDEPATHTQAENRFRSHVGAQAPSPTEPPAEKVAEAEANAMRAKSPRPGDVAFRKLGTPGTAG